MITTLLVVVLWLLAGLSVAILLGTALAEITARTDDEYSISGRR